MFPSITDKISEVRSHIVQGDVHLGLRRFTDCAIDTENPAHFRRVLEVLDLNDKNPQTTTAGLMELVDPLLETFGREQVVQAKQETVITVNKLGKKYQNGNFSLKDISFSTQAGEITGLVGENGNGKTTLLRLLAKELKASSGHVRYDFAKEKISEYELRTKLIYIPQRIPRWYGSLMNNLQFTLTLHGIKGEENRLWAEILVARMGLQQYKHLDWTRISSGYKTRFELAKNLLRKPVLFLLDEPLANLDILAQQTILQDIKFLSQSNTRPFAAVLSSQQLFEVEKVSDLVIFLRKGEARYQNRPGAHEQDVDEVVFEMDADTTKEKLANVFFRLGIMRIVNNGGTYITHFPKGTSPAEIYRAIADSGISFNYVRNISKSSRRYFAD